MLLECSGFIPFFCWGSIVAEIDSINQLQPLHDQTSNCHADPDILAETVWAGQTRQVNMKSTLGNTCLVSSTQVFNSLLISRGAVSCLHISDIQYKQRVSKAPNLITTTTTTTTIRVEGRARAMHAGKGLRLRTGHCLLRAQGGGGKGGGGDTTLQLVPHGSAGCI